MQTSSLTVLAEQIVPVYYKDLVLEGGYRLDLLVEDKISCVHTFVLQTNRSA